MNSFFISFEGPDGSGKSTVLEQVVATIKPRLVQEPLITREPGGSVIAEKIRQLILDPGNEQMSAKTEALLYAAARSQHIDEVVRPALASGKVVISDRFVDSSLAYQGMGRDLGIDAVKQVNDFATGEIAPDLTIFLDVAPAIGLKRIMEKRTNKQDRLDHEQLSFHEKVYRGYQQVNRQYPDRIKVVDASKPLNQVVATCVKIIANHLPVELLKD